MANVLGMIDRSGPVRSASTCFWIGLLSVALVAAGAFGAGQGLWPFTTGLLMVAVGFLLGIIAVLIGIFAAVRNRGGGRQGRRILIGLLLSTATIIAVGPWIYRGAAFPPIHDVATNLDNRPTFSVLPARADNLTGPKRDAWRQHHTSAYGDIKPLTLALSPVDAIALAKQVATTRRWDISATAPDRLEATETVSLFKFKDDIVVTATPSPNGSATVINMRSVSRVGESDFGLNAKRIREFLSDLKLAASVGAPNGRSAS
jgi:uncharacterized protein (DUF1499 family)